MKKIFIYIILLFFLFFPLVAKAKQIKTIAARIGGSKYNPSDIAEMAKFDIVLVNGGLWNILGNSPNTWERIHAINPKTKVLVYKFADGTKTDIDGWSKCARNQTGRWTTGDGVDLDGDGDGDESIGNNHTDWIMHRADCTTKITHSGNDIVLDVGNPGWQEFWWQSTKIDLFDQKTTCGKDFDGVIVDHAYSWETSFQSSPNCSTENVYSPTTWRTAMADWAAFQAAKFKTNRKFLLLNAGGFAIGYGDFVANNMAYWADLDSRPEADDHVLVLSEGTTVHQGGINDICFAEGPSNVKKYIDGMLSLKNINYAVMNRTNFEYCPELYGSCSYTKGTINGIESYGDYTWFDVFYYTLATYYIVYSERAYIIFLSENDYNASKVNPNGDYAGYYMSDYDLMDIGDPVGSYTNPQTNLYKREFEHGYVYINAGLTKRSNIVLGEPCKALHSSDHSNIDKDWNTLSNVTTFDLKPFSGAIFYKTSSLNQTIQTVKNLRITSSEAN